MDRFDDFKKDSNESSLERLKELDKLKRYGNINDMNVFGENSDMAVFNQNDDDNLKGLEEDKNLEQNINVDDVKSPNNELNNKIEEDIDNKSLSDTDKEKQENEQKEDGRKKFENKADELLDKVKGIKASDVWGMIKGSNENEDEPKELERLTVSVAKVMTVFLTLFILLITYISYFQIFKAPNIANKSTNPRVIAQRNEFLRGPIYDRNNQVIAESEKTGKLSQNRKYPYNDLFAHPIGYSDDRYSRSGLEQTYDDYLRDNNKIPVSFEGVINKLKSVISSGDSPKVGNSVVTTLDVNIQKAASDALGNRKGAVVVLNPKTGEVLASVSKPSFNPNDLENVMASTAPGKENEKNKILINRATNELYAPGSTFKVVTLSSAYENISGIGNKVFQDNGTMKIGNTTFSNQDNTKYGPIKVTEALKVSSNIVFGTIAMDLGNDKLKTTAEQFGFNENIPVNGIPKMATSGFPTLDASEKGNIAQSGIGQGAVVATPMHMALVASAIANNGVMMEPTFVKEVKNSDNETILKIDPKEFKTAISGDIASKVRSDMTNVVSGQSRAEFSDLRAINAAGKTGTADYKLANGEDGTPNAWFIGFAPADNPKVAIAVIIEEGEAGGKYAAPVAGKVMKAALGK